MNNPNQSEYRTVRGYEIANQRENRLTPAMEDYLEMACKLCLETGYTRVVKLSERLNVRPSSASKMISKLVAFGYLKYDAYESIHLTDMGQETGAYLLHRHKILEQFLRLIGNVDPLQEAELVEHSLKIPTISKINILLGFFEDNPDVMNRYENYKKRFI